MPARPSDKVFWFQEVGLWWPVADKDPKANYAYAMKRVGDSDITVRACKQRRTCVQAGAWVGLWPRRLARSFKRVLSFEVMPGCYEAARRNCQGFSNVELMLLGLGADATSTATVLATTSAGQWRIRPEGEETALLVSIDYLELEEVDAIILDVEGYELEALRGAKDTIERCRPVIHLEAWPQHRKTQETFMRDLGYRVHQQVHGDVIYIRR